MRYLGFGSNLASLKPRLLSASELPNRQLRAWSLQLESIRHLSLLYKNTPMRSGTGLKSASLSNDGQPGDQPDAPIHSLWVTNIGTARRSFYALESTKITCRAALRSGRRPKGGSHGTS
jgi:hypothetical protein